MENKKQKIAQPNIILLGKKTWRWRIRVFLLAPIWYIAPKKDKKNWSEFKHGLISHECEYDYNKPDFYNRMIFYDCKHQGCNSFTTWETKPE